MLGGLGFLTCSEANSVKIPVPMQAMCHHVSSELVGSALVVRPIRLPPDGVRDRNSTSITKIKTTGSSRPRFSTAAGLGTLPLPREPQQQSCHNALAVHRFGNVIIHPFLETELLKRQAEGGAHGLTWHYSRPPIESIEYEMDLRGCATELVL